jgi:hypothetical protein
LLSSKLPRRLVLLVTNVFGISPLLVWREMTLEEAQISDTHPLNAKDNFCTFVLYLDLN